MNYFESIADICHSNLSPQHKQYMLGRGFGDGTIADFKVGSFFSEAIRSKVPISFLEEKKILFKNKNGKYWSEFDKRVIIPIVDQSGECVGITGRVIEECDRAKYCNSNYSKSSVLFGLDKAKRDMLVNNLALVVEGNLDVMSAYESGFKNTVAICGTAMSEKHVHLLLRYCDRVVIGLDNDKAGRDAMARSSRIFEYYAGSKLLRVSALKLPDGFKDINELMSKVGSVECGKILSTAMPAEESESDHRHDWELNID